MYVLSNGNVDEHDLNLAGIELRRWIIISLKLEIIFLITYAF